MLRTCLLLSFFAGSLFCSPAFAAKLEFKRACEVSLRSLSRIFFVKNPLAEIGSAELSSFQDPAEAMKAYVRLLWWHRYLGPKEAFSLIRDLRISEKLPITQRPYGKHLHRTLDDAMLELSGGVTRLPNNPYRNQQRLDPNREVWRPSVKRVASIGKVAGTIVLTLWILQAGYGYFSAAKDGFTEIPTLDNRMNGFRLEFLRRYGYEAPADLEKADLKYLYKGYFLTESSVNHAIQYVRDTLQKFNQGIAQEQLNCESAVRLNNPQLLNDAISSLQMQWRDRPDVLRAPLRGKLMEDRINHILDEFDPDRKIWKKAESLNENSFESAK